MFLGNSKKISKCAYTIHLDQWQHWALINVLHREYTNPMLSVASSTIDATGNIDTVTNFIDLESLSGVIKEEWRQVTHTFKKISTYLVYNEAHIRLLELLIAIHYMMSSALEDDHLIPLDDHHAEDFSDGANPEPEVENLPPVAPIPNPNPRTTFHGPTPPWVECLETWSEEQDQPMSFNGDRSFYNISEGGSADRVLPFLVRRVARNEIQGRIALQRIAEVDANAGMHTIRTNRLEIARERSERDHKALLQALAETRAEVIELRVRQRVYERHMLDMERQLAELRVHQRDDRHQ
uniref:Uncharacterized protein n=1 Tax=Lactuca sativa TaxID=4236 RepID=A0A9R1WMF2_LACSA|nr:hypothetical protein LSAT_V11C100034260 [Lactuca sativa]